MRSVGPFRLTRLRGRGGLAQVWEAVHVPANADVAVKILDRAMDPGTLGGVAWALREEARAVAALDHPGIVRILDCGVVTDDEARERQDVEALEPGRAWFAMELANATLADELGRRHDFERIRAVASALLSALAHAHARGLVHRDVKAQNVLLIDRGGSEPWPVLADFGIAHRLRASPDDTDEGLAIGTPGTMAPEQLAGATRELGPWTDLYGLGCVAWSMAAGRPPFEADGPTALGDLHHDRELPPLPRDVEAPDGFGGWIATLAARDPARRPRSAAEAREALMRLVGGAGAPAAGTPPARAPAASSLPGIGLGLYRLRRPRLVGRDPEMEQLEQALTACAEQGRPRAIVLRGAAGYGKTRLAEHLAEHVEEAGRGVVLRVSHQPVPGPRDGLRGAVAAQLRCVGLSGQPLLEQVDVLTSILAPLRSETDVEAVAEWLGQEERGASDFGRHGAVRRWLARLALRGPVLLSIDDAQWGAESIDFVLHVLTTMPGTPVLAVLTVQDEALVDRPVERELLGRLEARDEVVHLPVGPLSTDATAALARELLALEPGVRGVVAERCAGNPLFAIQLVGDWVDQRVLEVGPSGFELPPSRAVDLPASLLLAWRRRLDRALAAVPEPERHAIERAAFLGRRVSTSEWRAVCAVDQLPAASRGVEALVSAALASLRDDGFELAHNMAREALIAGAAAGNRDRDHHRAIAAVLERLPRRADVDERLGRHRLDAGDPRGALAPLRAAIERRRDLGDYSRAEALLLAYERALTDAGVPEGSADWRHGWMLRSWLCRLEDRLDESERWAVRLEHAARHADDAASIGVARHRRADVLVRRGQFEEARPLLLTAVEGLLTAGEMLPAARAIWSLAWTQIMTGELDDAAAQLRRLKLVARTMPNAPLLLAHMGWTLAHALLRGGKLDDAAAEADAARELGEQVRSPLAVAHADNASAQVALRRGEVDRALELGLRSLEGFRELGSGESLVASLTVGEALTRRGRFEDAGRVLDDGRARVLAAGRVHLAWIFSLRRLESLAAQGDAAGFAAALDDLEAYAEPSGIVEQQAGAFVDAARARAGESIPPGLVARALAARDRLRR